MAAPTPQIDGYLAGTSTTSADQRVGDGVAVDAAAHGWEAHDDSPIRADDVVRVLLIDAHHVPSAGGAVRLDVLEGAAPLGGCGQLEEAPCNNQPAPRHLAGRLAELWDALPLPLPDGRADAPDFRPAAPHRPEPSAPIDRQASRSMRGTRPSGRRRRHSSRSPDSSPRLGTAHAGMRESVR
jgi:hypothetical protein